MSEPDVRKLLDDPPACVKRHGEKFGIITDHRRMLVSRREAECIYSDLVVLLNEREKNHE